MALDFRYVGIGLHLPQLELEQHIHSTFCPGSTLVFLPALILLSFFSDSAMEFSLLTQYLKYGRSCEAYIAMTYCIKVRLVHMYQPLQDNINARNKSRHTKHSSPWHHDEKHDLAYPVHHPSFSTPGFAIRLHHRRPIQRIV